MVKDSGYWVPVVFGWLPDKSETSYKVFFHMIQNKMRELGLELKVKSVLSDFELNILKSLDVMLHCPILGCFFHHKKCFQRRVDRKGLKTRYENDEYFRRFINETSAISLLPIADVEEGLKHVDKKYNFEDNKAQDFKKDFLKYILSFWINGPIPVRIWNDTHPSHGVLLCNLKSHMVLAEDEFVRIIGGLKKPAQRKTYRELADRRLSMKKQYLAAKEAGDTNAIDIYLSTLGHNVMSATMAGRENDHEETQSHSIYK